jgi:hypothetical protein
VAARALKLQHAADALLLCFAEQGRLVKRPLFLGSLLLQKVARVGFLALDFAARGFLESLCRCADSFHLWHVCEKIKTVEKLKMN